MTLEEAITVLRDYKMESALEATPKFEKALGLGIEALKAAKESRRLWGYQTLPRLPGETKEK